MFSSIGVKVRFSLFGESHGDAIGCVLEGLPAGFEIDMQKIYVEMARRAPGNDKTSTTRKESDFPVVLSGTLNGKTTGAPLAMMIKNENARSRDYENIAIIPRPSHADYPAHIRYGGYNDVRGGGHFSGRLTAPIVFAGALCKQILESRGIQIFGHISSIGSVHDQKFDSVSVDESVVSKMTSSLFPLIDPSAESKMRDCVESARLDGDSVGGTTEIAVIGLPAGLGSPKFRSIESRLSEMIFGIPAVKGLEFGDGFALSALRGSAANDEYQLCGEKVVTKTNHSGGVAGGITTGMPLILRVAIKPTPSISKPQQSVDLSVMKETPLVIHGRHDACIVPRVLPVIESAAAITLLDITETEGTYNGDGGHCPASK